MTDVHKILKSFSERKRDTLERGRSGPRNLHLPVCFRTKTSARFHHHEHHGGTQQQPSQSPPEASLSPNPMRTSQPKLVRALPPKPVLTAPVYVQLINIPV